jgi:hypothetical protein
LDGFAVLQGLLGTVRTAWARDLGDTLDKLAPYGPLILMALLSLSWLGFGVVLQLLVVRPSQAILSLILG